MQSNIANLKQQTVQQPINNNNLLTQKSYKQKQQNQHFLNQLIRIKSQQKLKDILQLWTMSQQQLQKYFINYQVHQSLLKNHKELLKNKTFKLAKNDNRIYFGEVVKQKKHGFGICIYKQLKIYEGFFKENQKSGLAYQIYPNGNVYIGQYQQNKKHKLGTFYWFTISSQGPTHHDTIQYYQGSWWGGLPSGYGVHQRAIGDKYQGEFRNGLKHGQGFEIFHNADRYKGQYINGLPQGYGQYVWSDGSNYKGDFKQGIRNGFGIWKKNNKIDCECYRGHYILDKKSGYGMYMWESGEYYKGDFFQDLRHGNGQLYKDDKLMYKGLWLQGKQITNLSIPQKIQIPSNGTISNKKQIKMHTNNNVTESSQGRAKLNEPKYFSNTFFKSYSRYPKGIINNSIERRQLNDFRIYSATASDSSGKKNKSIKSKDLLKIKKALISEQTMNPQTQNKCDRNDTMCGKFGHRNCIPQKRHSKHKKWNNNFNSRILY